MVWWEAVARQEVVIFWIHFKGKVSESCQERKSQMTLKLLVLAADLEMELRRGRLVGR